VDAARGGSLQAPAPQALSTAEREELLRLRRENKRLQMDRDILVKAAAFFAKENA
jgi:transposase-like protein